MGKIIIKLISIIFIMIFTIIPVNAEVDLGYNYVINYYKDSIDENNLIETIIGKENYDDEIKVDTNYKIPEGYTYSGEELVLKIEKVKNEINVIYSKKNNLSYCINYFYDGIIFVNNTECFYDQTYGKKITTFVDKTMEGYAFDSFDPITVLDIEENIMNVYYKSATTEEITPPNTGIISNIMDKYIKNSLKLLIKFIEWIC